MRHSARRCVSTLGARVRFSCVRAWWGLTLAAVMLIAALGPSAAQMEDDVSASYDYDGTLLLDSRNFRGMTQQGVWVVMFYSFSVVIKSTEEAHNCQRFTWLWGDLANRYSNLGGETRGGDLPSIHIAKYDASAEGERRYVSSVIGFERVEALPAIFIFEGDTVRKLPDWELSKMISDLPDIDRLEGYDANMSCDPPADYYDAYARNEQNIQRLHHFIAGYLADTDRVGLEISNDVQDGDKGYSVDTDYDVTDPTDLILESARKALDAAGASGAGASSTLFSDARASKIFSSALRSMAINDSDINSPCPLSFQTALHLAAAAGEADVVLLLLQHGAHIEVADSDGELPLHKAAEAGRRAVVRVLIEHGALIDAPRHSDGATALHLAAYTGHGDVCALLVSLGADIEARTPKGQSPLHFAAMSGYLHELNAIDFLVRAGADVDAQDALGWTPVVHTLLTYQPAMLKKLCDIGADVGVRDVAGNTALHHAMHYGHEDQVLTLLQHAADPYAVNRQGERAMDVLSREDNHEQDLRNPGELKWSGKQQKLLANLMLPYRYWLAAPVLPAVSSVTLGRVPAIRSDWSYKLKLLENKMRAGVAAAVGGLSKYVARHWHTFFGLHLLTNQNTSPYHVFTQRRLTEVEELYNKQTEGGDNEGDVWLFHMGDPQYELLKSFSELQRAVYLDQTWLAEHLLRNSVVDYISPEGSAEADTGQVLLPSSGPELGASATAGLLRHQGCLVDIEARDMNMSTPLIMAAHKKNVDMMHVLLKYGAKTEAADDSGWTALMISAQAGHLQAVKLLLEHGASADLANAVDKEQTALMAAAAGGHLEAIVELIRAGADLDRCDRHGQTPLNYAMSHRHRHVVEWMQNMGASMRVGSRRVGSDPKLSWQQIGGDYTPIEDPDKDNRNPRYAGPQ